MLDYVRFLKIGPPDCDVWGFPIEIRMMDLHTKYLLLVAAYVLSYSPRQAHGAALGSYVVSRQYIPIEAASNMLWGSEHNTMQSHC